MILLSTSLLVLFAVLAAAPTASFTPSSVARIELQHPRPQAVVRRGSNKPRGFSLFAVASQEKQTEQVTQDKTSSKKDEPSSDSEVEKLRAMAAKYRAEAAALEAERAKEIADATQRAFEKFDRDDDGEISLLELKRGLEEQLQTDLSEERVQRLMSKFDSSGDGKLQLEEFVGVQQFKNVLQDFARQEKLQAQELARIAKLEQETYQQIAEILNDGPPTNVDKVLSVLPYIFPLLDSLPYASFLVLENPDNPITQAIAFVYFCYRSVPFSGLVAAFTLTTLSAIPKINRLVRFNMLQAIYMDIALFFPGVAALLVSVLAQATNQQVPTSVVELTSNLLFFVSLSTIAYASGSSLLGKEPDKIPGISAIVKGLLPTMEMFKEWMDDDEKNDGNMSGKK